MLKVAINTHPLHSGHSYRGIGFYTRHLLHALYQIKDIAVEEFGRLREVKDADVVHYPYFDLFHNTLPLIKRFPTVVTIHDVIPILFTRYYPPGVRGKAKNLVQLLSLRNVGAVITDSQSSKKDIQKHLFVDEKKIYVIYLAPSKIYKPITDKNLLSSILEKYQLPQKFVLYVGNVNWNKNLVNMAVSCKKANIDLVLVGKSFEYKDDLGHPELSSFREFLQKFGNDPKIHILGFVDDNDIVPIVNLAKALLLPSFYEGFGLPILEAQACGTPVITSKIASMPEVAGEGAVFVNPYNTVEIANAIMKVVHDDSLREQLIQKGFENVKRFSWEKTAQETVEVYAKILEN